MPRRRLGDSLGRLRAKLSRSPQGYAAESVTDAEPGPASPSPPEGACQTVPALSLLQQRVWNRAYDELKSEERDIVDAYERIVCAKLREGGTAAPRTHKIDNTIGQTQSIRSTQMLDLVQMVLERSKTLIDVKGKAGEWMQVVNTVREAIDRAVKTTPQASIAWAGVCLGLEIIANPLKESSLNRKGITYVLTRMKWYWSLVDLLLDENKSQTCHLILQNELETHIVQLYQKLLLYQMRSVCLHHRNWAAVLLRDTLMLDNWGGQLDDIHSAEAIVRRDSEQYSTELMKSHLARIDEAAQSQNSMLDAILSAVENQSAQQHTQLNAIQATMQDQGAQQKEWRDDDTARECVRDLLVTDPREDKTRIEETKGGLLKKSSEWILARPEYRDFLGDAESHLFWLRGDPGKGKTMLLCGIIDDLSQSSKTLAYFFCQATVPELRSATAVVRGLIYLLILHQPVLISHLLEPYKNRGSNLFEGPNVWGSMRTILSNMLQDPGLIDPILIVDAIDECTTDRSDLIKLIVELSGLCRAKWIISSRNWPEIEQQLKRAKKLSMRLELNRDVISQAVHTFILDRLDQLDADKGYDEETRASVHKELVSKADDTFLWVALVCQSLGAPEVMAYNTLEILGSIPFGLAGLYEGMLQQMSAAPDGRLRKQVLATSCVVCRPITLAELKSLVEFLQHFKDKDIERVVESCGSFLTLREGVIYFVHQSAEDFLLSPAGSDQIFASGIKQQHGEIFFRSMRVLKGLKRDIYHLKSPGYLSSDISRPNPDRLAPMAYSCVYWVDHFISSNISVEAGESAGAKELNTFLREKFLYWLEALSLLRNVSSGLRAARKLLGYFANCDSPELVNLLQDARRFIQSHKAVIEIAPLQTYASALVFSPAESQMATLFKHEKPKWNIVKLLEPKNWNSCIGNIQVEGSPDITVRFSPDGKQFATCSGGSDSIQLWDSETLDPMFKLFQNDIQGTKLTAFSTNNLWLATASCNRMPGRSYQFHSISVMNKRPGDESTEEKNDDSIIIKVWDRVTGTCLSEIQSNGLHLVALEFLDHDQLLLVSESSIKTWHWASGELINSITPAEEDTWIHLAAFSPKTNRMVVSFYRRRLWIYDLATGAAIKALTDIEYRVYSVAFLPDGKIATTSEYNSVQMWNPETCRIVETLPDLSLPDWVSGKSILAHSPDGVRLACMPTRLGVAVYDATSGEQTHHLKGHTAKITCLEFSPTQDQLISASEDGIIKVWDLSIRHQPDEDDGGGQVEQLLSPDTQRLAIISKSSLKVFETVSGACVYSIAADSPGIVEFQVRAYGFSPDSRLFVYSLRDSAKIYDVMSGTCMENVTIPDFDWIEFSPDSLNFACGSNMNLYEDSIWVWDMAKGTCIFNASSFDKCFDNHPAWSIQSDTRRLFALNYRHGTVDVWNMANETQLGSFQGAVAVYAKPVFSSDGKWVMTRLDHSAKLWNLETGICDYEVHGLDEFSRLTLSPDATWFATFDHHETKVWDFLTGKCIHTFFHGFSKQGAAPEFVQNQATDAEVTVSSVAFSPCKSLMAISARGHRANLVYSCVEIWDTSTWSCVRTVDLDKTDEMAFLTNDCLSTERGNLDLAGSSASQQASFIGYGVSSCGEWIIKGEERFLWIPLEYRKVSTAIWAGTAKSGWYITGSKATLHSEKGPRLVIKFE